VIDKNDVYSDLWFKKQQGTPLSVLDRFYRVIIKILVAIAASVLSAMMFLIMTDVVLRYVFNSPLSGSYEIIEYMMAILIAFAVVYCAHQQGHVSVDILFDHLPKNFQAILRCLTTLVVFILFLLIAWQNVLYIKETYDQKLTSTILYIPTFPFVAAVALGLLALCMVLLVDFLNALIGAVSK